MISIIKKNLHRDICRNPELHGFVLNLYLNGEEYPHKVNDYFPKHIVQDQELLSAMNKHMEDEDRHVLMYRKTIQKMQQPIVELPMADVYNHVIKKHTPEGFHILEKDSPDTKTRKLASFMAHLYFLEKRISQSLEFHADACQLSPTDYAEKVVSKVLSDEQYHVEYTKNAVFDLLPRQQALDMMSLHQLAEKKANIEFSSQQLRKVVTHYKLRINTSHRWIYSISSRLLEWNLQYA